MQKRVDAALRQFGLKVTGEQVLGGPFPFKKGIQMTDSQIVLRTDRPPESLIPLARETVRSVREFRDIISLVLRSAAGLVAIGVGTGLLLALGTNRAIAAMLFGIDTSDIMT